MIMNIPSDALKNLLSAILEKAAPAARESVLPEPATDLAPGREINADVLERQPNGRFLVRAGGELFDMRLPGDVRPGTSIRMTYVGDTPRITFSIPPQTFKGAEVSLSSTGKWLGTLAAGTPPNNQVSTPSPARTAMIPGGLSVDRTEIASKLRQAVGRSGLFYESHLARWREGAFPLDELMKEPQAQASAIFREESGRGKTAIPGSGEPVAGRSPMPHQSSTTGNPPLPLPDPTGRSNRNNPLFKGDYPATGNDMPGRAAEGDEIPSPAATMPETSGSSEEEPAGLPLTENRRTATTDTPLPRPLDRGQQQDTSTATDVAATETPPDRGDAGTSKTERPKGKTSQENLPPQAAGPGRPEVELSRLSVTQDTIDDNASLSPAKPGRLHPNASADDGRQSTPETPANRIQTHQATQRDMPSTPPLFKTYNEPQNIISRDIAPREAFIISGEKSQATPFEPPPLQTIPIIRQQLEFLQNSQFVWQGEAWPNQQFEWKIGRDRSGSGERRPDSWETSLTLELPSLGRISARLHLSGGEVRISVTAAEQGSCETMEREKRKLIDGMEAAGLRLAAVEVKLDPSPRRS